MRLVKMVCTLVLCLTLLPVSGIGSVNVHAATESDMPVAVADTLGVEMLNRASGTQVAGSDVEAGGVQWTASPSLVYYEDENESYVTSGSAEMLANASVPFRSVGEIASIEAEIKPSGVTDWVGLGLLKGTGPIWQDGAVWIYVNKNGEYQAFVNGTKYLVKSGALLSYDASGYTKVKVQLNSTEATISIWLNEELVVNQHDISGIEGFAPNISHAGFVLSGATAYGQRVKNLIVRGETLAISDTLAINGTNRTVGASLKEKETEFDGRKWEAGQNLVFAGDESESYITSSVRGSSTASVPFKSVGPVSSVEADIYPAGVEDWIGLGLNKGTGAMWLDGQIWIYLNKNGEYQAFLDRTQNMVKNGVAPGFDANGYTRVKVEYNASEHTVSIWMNGQIILDKYDVGQIAGFIPDINYASFMFSNATANGQRIKNFIVKGVAAPMEPEYPVDLEPFAPSDFPIGVFEDALQIRGNKQRFKEIIADLHSHGLDSIMITNGNVDEDHFMFEATDKYGVGVHYGPHANTYDWMHSEAADPQLFQPIADNIINKLKDHPSIKSINLSDEPFLEALNNHVVATDYFHENAPGLKISTPLVGLDRVGPIFSAAGLDTLLIDVYPAAKHNPVGDFTLNAFGYSSWDFVSYVRKVVEEKPEDTPLWMILQTHKFDSGRFSTRTPVVGELRMQNWMAIGEGATGIFWFIYGTQQSWLGLEDSPAHYDEVSSLANRVRPLKETLLNAKKDEDRFTVAGTGNTQPYVSTLVKRDGSKSYVVAVNTDAEQQQELTLSSAYYTGSLKDLETGAIYEIGTSAISFLPGDGKLFEVIPTTSRTSPVVQLSTPDQGTILSENGSLTLQASATDPQGIAKVEFWANGKRIGTAASAPFKMEWKELKAGSYTLTAKAISSQGVAAQSQPVHIMVLGSGNKAQNPSFEEGENNEGIPVGWTFPASVTPVLDESASRSGGTSLQIAGAASGTVMRQSVNLEPYKEYELSAWVKTDKIKGTGLSLRMSVEGAATYRYESEPLFGTKGWTRLVTRFMTPTVVNNGWIDIRLDSLSAPGTVWLDDISLTATGRDMLIDDLALHWTFDEGRGTNAYDSTALARHGSISRTVDGVPTNEIPWVPAYYSGKIGSNSMYLDGGINYVANQETGVLDEQSFTISTWLKPYENGRRMVIYSNKNVVLEINEAGALQLKMLSDSAEGVWTTVTGGPVSTNNWSHVAVVYDAEAGAALYINGELASEPNNAAYLSQGSSGTVLGTSLQEAGVNFHGYLDDFRIYQRKLNESELSRLILNAEYDENSEEPGNGNGNGNGNGSGSGSGTGGEAGSGLAEVAIEDGIVVVRMKDSQKSVSIPISQITGYPLQVQTGEALLKIESAELNALLGRAGNTAGATLEIEFAQASEQVLKEAAGKKPDDAIRIVSPAYTVSVLLVTADGKKIKLEQTAAGVSLELPLLATDIDRKLTSIYYYDALNKKWVYNGGIVNSKSERITLKLKQISPYAYAAMEYKKNYADIPNTHWAMQAIQTLAARQVIDWENGNRFNPSVQITRAEFVAMLVRSMQLEIPKDGLIAFTDVDANAWYAGSIKAAVAAGLVTGIDQGRFAPERHISRAEMAVLMSRALGMTIHSSASAAFSDSQQIPAWALGHVAALHQAGLIKGKGNNKFVPEGKATRAEVAMILFNMLTLEPGLK
ncbi:S-layer homology domain-containing protein [Paenibacillus sp. PAMC21692]|uniref:S-layer homology domain-containing protein n=1 Tax=Paenibacillus sp. PAMC21692 TaxID=2762320 RepID=UPI00164D9D14|nr:S-layer homology domain-containing protein [Paenibacillus sp. PAMC21692]QNK55965.1 S-layer homology domain-containing protein [Paenibacillus sp. PAMC21692]